MSITKEEIVARERLFWEANMKRDAQFFRDNLVDEALTVAGFGIADKAVTVEGIAHGGVEYAGYFMHDVHILFLSTESASISYRCVIQAAVQGKPHTIVVNVTTIHVLRDGAWKVALHQQTAAQR